MKASIWFAIVGSLLLTACSRPEPAPDPVRAVRTLTVAPQSAGGTLEYAGEVKARTESRLSFRVGGKIVKRSAELGDVVKAGQTLAQLDPQDLKLGQDSARAAVQSAQASYDLALADYNRYRDLRDQGFISGAELERRDATLKSARAGLEQARAQAATQGNQTGYALLLADASGAVTGIDAEPGMVIAAGTPVLRLAHDGPRDAVFAVPEDKLELVRAVSQRPGSVKVRLWGATGEPMSASVREVAPAADPVTRTFLVKADIGRSEVRLGQTVTVVLELPASVGVTRLPLSALKEEQGKTIVWIVDPTSMTVRQQVVQLAGAQGNEAVVSGGLTPGQRVVTAGVHVLTPGQKVKFYVDPAAAAGAALTAAK